MADRELWADFWAEAELHGCTAQFPVDVQRSLERKWRDLFAALPAGASLLDIGCGRGALLDLAGASGALQRNVEAVGVDLATADCLDGEGFHIRGGVDATALPFPDLSFDCVVSQFGVEYAGLQAATAEAGRVGRDRLMLLTHAAEGVVAAQSAEQARQIASLVGERGLDKRLRDALLGGTLREAISRARGEIGQMIGKAENTGLLDQLYLSVGELGRAASTMADAEIADAIEFMFGQLARHGARMDAMAAAAPDRAGVEAAVALLVAKGFDAAVVPQLSSRGDLVGYWVEARRKGTSTPS